MASVATFFLRDIMRNSPGKVGLNRSFYDIWVQFAAKISKKGPHLDLRRFGIFEK